MDCNWKWTGATLIAVVAVVLAVLTSAAMPTQSPNNIALNEAKAISTLRSIAVAQAVFRAAKEIDTNCDAAGEYGYFAELAGMAAMRVDAGCLPAAGVWGVDELDPPLLRSPFGMVTESSVSHQGYLFQMWLPQPTIGGVVRGEAEDRTGGKMAAPFPDSINCAQMWCCYAWPVDHDRTGRRAFVINERGQVLRCANRNASPFSGKANTPYFDEAFTIAGDISSPLRIGIAGGNAASIWWPVH